MAKATPQQAVNHPTWSMGAKISVDSATLMNKALEVIEARYLFDMDESMIDVIVHPQSLIHSMVEYCDGSILSQMGPSDMRTPIAYCLGWPKRLPTSGDRLDLASIQALTFEEPDLQRFASLALVRDVLRADEPYHAVIFNAANEIAVAAFLKNEITFGEIMPIIERSLDFCDGMALHSIEDVISYDSYVRRVARSIIENDLNSGRLSSKAEHISDAQKTA
jgi:1-deoxy-D-xylulose-5-phosphate reductoisomerase